MRYVCLLMATLFALFTYLQFNDLEQYNTRFWQGWVLTYGFCSVITFVSIGKSLPRWFYLCVAIIALVAAAYWALGIEWEKTVLYNKNNPSGNESGGLLVIAAWFGVMGWKHASLGTPEIKK